MPGGLTPPSSNRPTAVLASVPDGLRAFGDATATRKAIFDQALDAATKLKPVSNARYSLHLENVGYEDPEEYPITHEKDAILRGETLARRLRGDWVLKDTAGKELERKHSTVASVPYMTPRGTFILGGNEHTLAHQMRLRAGVYTREKENGELEAHANVLPGKGISHRFNLEPETGVFRFHVAQANLPLYPILRHVFNVPEAHIRHAWGNELFEANAKKDDPQVVHKLYQRLVRRANVETAEKDKIKAVQEALSKMEFDPEVNHRTLGAPVSKPSPDMLHLITKKLLAVSRGEAESDDRDALAYQNFLGPEDLIAERIQRSGSLINPLLWKVSTKGTLKSLPAGVLSRHVMGAITDSGLGMPLEEINPLDVFDQQTRVTRLGVGGIPSMDAVPDEARNVQPSHLGYIDLLRTPESFKVGVDSRLAFSAMKGKNGKIYAPFRNVVTGRTIWKTPQEVADTPIAHPGELASGRPMIAVQVGSKTRIMHRNGVGLEFPHAEHWFSPVTNLVPLKSTIKGQRVAMGSRFSTQALPLEGAEAPLVRGQVPGRPGLSFEEHYGPHMGAVHAKKLGGRVREVTPDGITVAYADGTSQVHQLYNHFPYNRKTYLHNTPVVQVGDPIQPGQLLAKSNFTDDKGHIALGLNLRTAYFPFRGRNYEDAWVISESAAKKLSSEHMYQHTLDIDENLRRGKKNFIGVFPAKFKKEILDNVDDDGVVKPGTVVKPGDPLILAAMERPPTHKSVHAAHKGSFADRSVTWEHHHEGVVTDVAKTPKGFLVAVKTVSPMQVGDKMAGRYGDKGVVAHIQPDDQMPRDPKTNEPYEVLANPLGIISRTNPGQLLEAQLGKIAAKTGKPIVFDDFSGLEDATQWTQEQLAKAGLSDMEDVLDPVTNRVLRVHAGNRYFMKLHHTSESKGQGRGLGAYTSEDTPAKGGTEGAKRLALMDVNALLSHGALGVLRDLELISGQKNQQYWATAMAGFRPPTPDVPMVYRKFIDQLRAAGVNVQRKGSQLHLMALTDRDINHLAENRDIENAETVDWKNGLEPVPGGLFDMTNTGGHGGTKWSAIKLAEAMPNPVMEEPIRRVLHLTTNQFLDVLAGRKELHGKTGPQAIQEALSHINLKRELETTREEVKSSRKGVRDEAIRRLGYLKAAEEKGIHPKEWVVNRVPVLPPAFRPVSLMKGGTQLISDPNYLYKEVFDANKNLEALRGRTDDLSHERATLYNAFKAVTGLGDPVQPKNQERHVKGMLAQIFGDSPKFGTVQQKLLSKTLDLVGRAVVTPDPDLSMDEVGLPEARAWEVYTPFLVRRLVRKGVNRVQALKYVKDKSSLARKALIEEMDARPILVNRAPVLHRYGLLAFYPRLTKGDTLRVSPLVVGGFGMDFDGDASNYMLPPTDEAAEEAIRKMLPSRNLIGVSTLKKPMYMPRQEYVGGLYSATSGINKTRKPRIFATTQDMVAAYERGELDPHDPVEIINH